MAMIKPLDIEERGKELRKRLRQVRKELGFQIEPFIHEEDSAAMVERLKPLRSFLLKFAQLLESAEVVPQMYPKQFAQYSDAIRLLAYSKSDAHRSLGAAYRNAVESALTDSDHITPARLRLEIFRAIDSGDRFAEFLAERQASKPSKGEPLLSSMAYDEMLTEYESMRKSKYEAKAKQLAPQDFAETTQVPKGGNE